MLVNSGGGGGFQGISAAVAGVVAASNAGFAISENGGQELIKAIDELAVAVADALNQSHVLTSHLPLGTTPNANVYKPFLATVASDPTQGAIPALRKLHADLVSAHAAVQKAVDNYRNTDHGNASTVKNSGTWV